jgi:hypothetical protein
MYSFPNSFARHCDSALTPNLPGENALVSTFACPLDIAPVKIRVPLFPFGCSISLSLNAERAPRAKEKAIDRRMRCHHRNKRPPGMVRPGENNGYS